MYEVDICSFVALICYICTSVQVVGCVRNSCGEEDPVIDQRRNAVVVQLTERKSRAEVKRCKGVIFGAFEGRGARLQGTAEQV